MTRHARGHGRRIQLAVNTTTKKMAKSMVGKSKGGAQPSWLMDGPGAAARPQGCHPWWMGAQPAAPRVQAAFAAAYPPSPPGCDRRRLARERRGGPGRTADDQGDPR